MKSGKIKHRPLLLNCERYGKDRYREEFGRRQAYGSPEEGTRGPQADAMEISLFG